ncbi:hypothetical protein F2P81_011351 [Scophthalmus maximus]|uniref:Uncharacterized protein n=1 Tax=Scophthalmus maximus TaxID=52904 RepID=A0A6A4STM0_SCOMX|nr:hypothetical protein F2P81_011351 [Scophthalmus maximus]
MSSSRRYLYRSSPQENRPPPGTSPVSIQQQPAAVSISKQLALANRLTANKPTFSHTFRIYCLGELFVSVAVQCTDTSVYCQLVRIVQNTCLKVTKLTTFINFVN